MNIYGSYRKLLHNSKQAMFAAVEIYNKPKFDYREEVFVILLVNAWELLLLAILSKNKKRIFRPKIKKEPYKTLNFDDSFNEAYQFFDLPEKDKQKIKLNLDSIRKYRNDAIHYYGNKQTQHCIYVLSQSAIKNYGDTLNKIFNHDITSEINIILLPLSFNNQPNFIEFFNNNTTQQNGFVKELFKNLKSLEENDSDTSKYITECHVKIESKRKIKSTDFTSNFDKESSGLALKNLNPDDSYPFFQKDIIGNKTTEKHKNLNKKLTSYQFQAIVYAHSLKEKKDFCWCSKKGGAPRYGQKIVTFLNKLTEQEIVDATKKYKER